MPLKEQKYKYNQTILKVYGFGENRKIKLTTMNVLRASGVEDDSEQNPLRGLVNDEKLSENTQIFIPHFGVFETRKRSERISVNPQTQQRYLVPPSIVATFKPASGIKEQLKTMEEDGK